MDLTLRTKAILAHYVRYWGEPTRVQRFHYEYGGSQKPVLVAVFPPHDEGEDWVYATLGMSEMKMTHPSKLKNLFNEFRSEVFLYADLENDELMENLFTIAMYPFEHKTLLAPTQTIPGNEGIVSDSPLTDILITRPYGEDEHFEIVHHINSAHTRLLWMVPIYRSERLLLKQQGWEHLKAKFYEQGTNTSDFLRPSVE